MPSRISVDTIYKGDPVRILMRLVAKPDKIAELRAVLLTVAGPTRQEAGCRGYEVLQNDADPCDFTIVEHWVDAAALDAHLAAAHTQEAFKNGVPLLAKEPDMGRYAVVV
jgi:quinol monooxygenase YgiN